MNLKTIGNALLSMTGKNELAIRAKSPDILLWVGIAGIITATGLACKSTLKVKDVIDEHNEKMKAIEDGKYLVKSGQINQEEYSDMDIRKDTTMTYVQTGIAFLKLYGPAIVLGTASVACIIGGHRIMKARNFALAAAYKLVQKGFDEYRKRVIEEHGEQTDYNYKNGIRAVEVTKPAYTDENGKKHKEEKMTVLEQDPNGLSVYARFFDESCSQWSKTPEYNLMFIRAQQNYFNDLLKARGHVFLNEVYDTLGIPRSGAGAIVGWVIGKGDDFIDFGIFDGENERARAFVNGNERSILLDFNVDGVIYDCFTNLKV